MDTPPRRGLSTWVAVLVVALTLGLGAVAAPRASAFDQAAPGVPGDGRAWELVTPEDPSQARIAGFEGTNPFLAITPDGDRIAYNTSGVYRDATYGAFLLPSFATRGPGGWSSRSLSYPHGETLDVENLAYYKTEGILAFDRELTDYLAVNALPGLEEERGLYAGGPGGYQMLENIGTGGTLAASTGDLQHILFSSTRHLLPADAPRGPNFSSLYEREGAALRLVDVANDGSLLTPCGVRFDNATADLAKIVFSARVGLCNGLSDVFLRADGQTRDISTSRCTLADCGPESNVTYAGMSPDGGSVFLYTAERLTDEDESPFQSIYRYDIDSDQLSLLFDHPAEGDEFYLVEGAPMRTSADGSSAYFVASGRLLPQEEEPFAPNLYLATAGQLRYVGSLLRAGINSSEVAAVQVSRDGRFAIFASPAKLVAGDEDESPDLYRYDLVSDSYELLSKAPVGDGGYSTMNLSPTGLSAEEIGHRTFFETSKPLLAQDRNQLSDVYEWSEDTGLTLLSGGVPGVGADYSGVSPDGDSVVFRTQAALLPRDRDPHELDFYVARVGGGLPEPPAPPTCEANCSGPAVTPPPRRAPLAAGGPLPRRLELARVGPDVRRRLASRGSAVLLVEAPGPGRLSASGRAGGEIVVSGGAVAKAPGPVRLRLRLTADGRAGLARGEKLRVRLLLRQAPESSLRTAFTLGGDS